MSNPYHQISPAELVQDFAEGIITRRALDEMAFSNRERYVTGICNAALIKFNMLGGYQVSTENAFVIEEDPVPGDNGSVTFHRLDRHTLFQGQLIGQRMLKIARVGDNAVRAACLTFKDAVIQTRNTARNKNVVLMRNIDQNERIYVPAFAVRAMERTRENPGFSSN